VVEISRYTSNNSGGDSGFKKKIVRGGDGMGVPSLILIFNRNEFTLKLRLFLNFILANFCGKSGRVSTRGPLHVVSTFIQTEIEIEHL
jgi:hypothetical protein